MIITVASFKGGVGKSPTALRLAASLAKAVDGMSDSEFHSAGKTTRGLGQELAHVNG